MKHRIIPDPELKKKLDSLYLSINVPEFIDSDPVKFPHRYKKNRDREIAAFLASAIAWGNRTMILKSAEKIFSFLGDEPHKYIMEGKFQNLKASIRACKAGNAGANGEKRGKSIHRTFFETDLLYYFKGLRECYLNFGSLEKLFSSVPDLWEGISLFRTIMAKGNNKVYSRHISNPEAGSACKRLHLAFRWLVREGPVDLGIWKSISPSSLYIPLDVHVGRAARTLGLLDKDRNANDKKAVIRLTERLREFCPEDPVKYDYSLFGWHF